MPVYAVVNQKGGVGKTTTAVNAATALALDGRRVLLVDLDPQGNATSGLGVDKNAIGHAGGPAAVSTYHVLIEDVPLRDAIMDTIVPGLRLAPSNLHLAGAEMELMPRMAREDHMRRALEPVRADYDYVFLDTPPSLGLLTVNALAAADFALVPIQCEYYALEGVSQLMRTVQLVRQRLNPRLEIGVVVLTMYDARSRLARQVADEVRRAFGDRLAHTVVPRNVRLSEAPSHGRPAALYDARSRGAAAYRLLAREIDEHGQAWTG